MELKRMFTFETTPDKGLKVIYNGSEEIQIGLTLVLRNGERLDSVITTFYCQYHWTIPGFNYKGCTHLSFYDIKRKKHLFNWLLPPEITQGVDKQKIIGIGLNKTGTTSFERDLSDLGYCFPPTSHGAIKIISDVFHGDLYSMYSSLNNPRFTGFQDLPYSLPKIYEKIYKNRPNDLYVLTVRENDNKWIRSVISYYNWIIKGGNINGNNEIFEYFHGFDSILYSNFNVPLFKIWGLKSLDNLEKNLSTKHIKRNLKLRQVY